MIRPGTMNTFRMLDACDDIITNGCENGCEYDRVLDAVKLDGNCIWHFDAIPKST